MPVAKHRADLAELISIAAVQRKRLNHRQRRHHSLFTTRRESQPRIRKFSKSIKQRLENVIKNVSRQECSTVLEESVSDFEQEDNLPEKETQPNGSRKQQRQLALRLSSQIHWFLELPLVRFSRLFVIFMAFFTLSYEASNGISSFMDNAVVEADIVIDSYFIMEGVLKLLALYAHLDMHKVFRQKVGVILFLRRSGIIDIIIASCSVIFARNRVGDWFRLVRILLISSFALEEMPHLEVLLSGISFGMRSIVSTWLLLSLVFLVFASCALTVFEDNDPFHFGSIALSMWTFFELATLDNWSRVMYINMYGCDSYPSDYTAPDNSTATTERHRYGKMILPVCDKPEAQPIAATVIFVTFIILCGLILINLTIAAVTAGINDRLDELRKEDLMRELSAVGPLDASDDKSGKNLITDPDMLLLLMQQVWKEHDDHARKQARAQHEGEGNSRGIRQTVQDRFTLSSDANNRNSFFYVSTALKCTDMRQQSVFMRDLTGYYLYKYVAATLVTFSALVELWSLQHPESRYTADYVQLVLQFLFSFDLYCKTIASYPAFATYYRNRWNVFDTAIVIVTWVPVFTIGMKGKGVKYIGLFRVLRILRLLKMLTWIPELNVILHSIASSARALVYVIMLMFAFFYHFAVAGIFLFEDNDPQHFGSLFKAFVTLFQCSSLDDWSEVARTNMYGCDLYGYDTGEDYYDSQCVNPVGLGWIAAWYFILIVIIGVMVLLSLFVGIIITSMELLKEGIKEEKEVWAKVKVKQKQYNMRDTTIKNLLEIFDLIDVGENGKLTLNELKPVLEIVALSESNQFSLFMMVDNDSSGQIDFSEFLELIHLVGKAYKANNAKRLKKGKLLPHELKSKIKHAHNQSSGSVLEKLFQFGSSNARSGTSSKSIVGSANSQVVPAEMLANEVSDDNDDESLVEFVPIGENIDGEEFLSMCRKDSDYSSKYSDSQKEHKSDDGTKGAKVVSENELGMSFYQKELGSEIGSIVKTTKDSDDECQSLKQSDLTDVRNFSVSSMSSLLPSRKSGGNGVNVYTRIVEDPQDEQPLATDVSVNHGVDDGKHKSIVYSYKDDASSNVGSSTELSPQQKELKAIHENPDPDSISEREAKS
mmetsp:Transcript_13936/g.20843  ORF Transcript_13936/g.20843 Transcript_13936/m.20843 type:complete len:1108 (+) Transcript_13936:199-3522(+)